MSGLGTVARRLGALGLVLLTAVPAAAAPATAAATAAADVPPDRQVLILARALAYDDNLKTRAGTELLIAVLWRPGQPASEGCGTALTAAFKALGSVKVQGLPLKSVSIGWTGEPPLSAAIAAQGIDALYVCGGLEGELPTITTLSRRVQVVTLASQENQVGRGLSLGVFAVEGRPTIVVNIGASRREGAAFGSDLLRLAKVIK